MEHPRADAEPRRDGDVTWEGTQGHVRASRPAPGVALFVFDGRMTAELVPRIRLFVAEELERVRSVDIFFDTEKMTGYHPDFRNQMTEWHAAIKPQTRSANVLVRSKIIAMAIAVANMVTGGLLKSHADRRSFDVALSDACRTALRS